MRIFAWCDSPLAPTGFGRSANHVLFALHDAGHEITQLAVNVDTATLHNIPWRVHVPGNRTNDPYGMGDLPALLQSGRFDALWTTFDPEVPWFYKLEEGGTPIDLFASLRQANPGFKMAGWFPIDGGPLSDAELAVLGMSPYFDAPVTMASHVYDLAKWTMALKGKDLDVEKYKERLHLIPHAVDTAAYKIPTEEQRRAAKAAMGLPPDAFVILQVERNQQRKQNYLAMEAMEILLKRRPELRGKVVLYQHMIPDEENTGCRLGFNLPEMAWRYGLRPGRDVFWPPGFVSDDDMANLVYAGADAFLSVSTGEGFQYPAWEALATGVPLVVPNDSARKAWFTGVPNVHLYKSQDRRLVMRGGYKRRMAYADPAEAAKVLRKLIDKPPAMGLREAGRAFVEKTAAVEDVKGAWVELYAKLESDLAKERSLMKIANGPAPEDTTVVGFSRAPGAGDLIMAGPALRALRDKTTVRLHVPRGQLELAALAEMADEYSTERLPSEGADLSDLFFPTHRLGWSDPAKPRAHVFAERLDVPVEELEAARAQMAVPAKESARASFRESFGVSPGDCVALCLESGNPARSMPAGYLPQLIDAIKGVGATPLLLGKTPIHCRQVGVVDLTGQTDMPTALALLSEVAAVITTDSGSFHMAAMLGTPIVGCFTLFDPEARSDYYAAPMELLGRLDGDYAGLAEESPSEVWRDITPARISAALRRLLEVDAPALEKSW